MYAAVFVLVAVLLVSLTGCNSAEFSVVETTNNQQLDPDIVPAPSDADYVPVYLADPLQTAVTLKNSGAESPVPPPSSSVEIQIDAWQTQGNCSVASDSVSAGNGDHAFRLGAGCELQQLTEATLSTGDAVSVLFEASATESDELNIELLRVTSQGRVVVVAEQSILFANGAERWRTYQVLMNHGVGDNAHGDRLGIRIKRASALTSSPVFLDAISIKLFQPPVPSTDQQTAVFSDSWDSICDQIWTGEHYWANRLRDWHVLDGRLQTRHVSAFRPLRTLHRIATVLSEAPADFTLQVDTGVSSDNGGNAMHGILLGAGTRMDYRGASLIHNRSGLNGGIILAIDADGRAFIRDNGINNNTLASGPSSGTIDATGARLIVNASYENTGHYVLNLNVLDTSGRLLSSANARVLGARLLGNVALVASAGTEHTVHWFNNFTGAGPKLLEVPQREFGPVLFSSYTVSRNVLTLNAQFPPVCDSQTGTPQLQIIIDGQWQTVAQAKIDPQSYTARFSIDNWDTSQRAHYRVAASFDRSRNQKDLTQNSNQRHSNTQTTAAPTANETISTASATAIEHYFYRGTIQADPVSSDEFVLGVFNCRPGILPSDTEGWIQQYNKKPFTWTRDRIVMPHTELLTNAAKHQSHLIAFLGDQIYEFDPNGFVDKTSTTATIEDYLWKWYQFGWSVRDLTRNTPSFIIPDDHDVYQSNLWGHGGRVAATEMEGGYIYPAEFVKIVQRTQTGSLPAAFDPTPVDQPIDVYYTDMVYGEIGFAILEDRKFKTGPQSLDPAPLLLGQRQLDFLDTWARDWKGHTMKVAVSQSPFSQSTTHSTARFSRIEHNHDSNGWPKVGRDKAVAALRRAFAPHINGDQHLGMTLQHGVNNYNDAIFSFSGPSMLNVFPRAWDPRNTGNGPGDPTVGYRGNWIDDHGNLISVLAAANPRSYYQPDIDDAALATAASSVGNLVVNSVGNTTGTGKNTKKDDLGIGYGIVRIDKSAHEYTFEAWPADQNPNDPLAEPYKFWPITIKQTDNDGRVATGTLSARTASVAKPVVEVINEQTGELIYARRYPTATVSAPVYDKNASYTLTMSDPETGYIETFNAQRVAQ